MQRAYAPQSSTRFHLFLFIVALMLLVAGGGHAQDPTPPPASISFDNGIVTVVTAEGIVVNGLNILITPDVLADGTIIQVGSIVDIDGLLQPDGTVVAVTVQVQTLDDNDDDDDGGAVATATADAPPTSTPAMTPTVSDVMPEPSGTPPAVDVDDGFIIVVEGPVQQINVNIITIYNINIALERDDLALTVLQVGDVIRVEGLLPTRDDDNDNDNDDDDDDGGIVGFDDTVIIAVSITFISVEVIIVDGLIWRDSGDCTNAPPVFVVDAGGGVEWLIRCTQPQVGGGGSGRGDNDNDNDNDNDDDDDD